MSGAAEQSRRFALTGQDPQGRNRTIPWREAEYADSLPAAGSVLLVRYRPGIVGETHRTVHVVEASTVVPGSGVVSALCGVVLTSGELEAVALWEGMPCMACVFRAMNRTETYPNDPTIFPR